MKGKLYGVSVGPGDPELLTLKAKRIIEECDVVAYPVRVTGERSVALGIIGGTVDVSRKCILELVFRMSSDKEIRALDYDDAIAKLTSALEKGHRVCMITLGDAMVYSTFMRVGKEIENRGYEIEVIPGVPSFCDGAARAKIPLMIGTEGLAVVSAAEGSDFFRTALNDFDNVVIMKAYGSMERISEEIESLDKAPDVFVVSNIGLEDQYVGPLDKNRKYGYFTTIIVKKTNGDREAAFRTSISMGE
ncbi:MAG: precorrin-2 C(20)-methyltransferase [Candidatus Methanoplasma sp.]|jgi:precorrin-2/cobalt-factor-2 C20-methyltransferase|nr:precorrin-2 C(20)-methyltransferase [Candidatus Methanoplasma sp.]